LWLRDDEGAWVQSPQTRGAYNINVNDLILPNERRRIKIKLSYYFLWMLLSVYLICLYLIS
jgi:hypothetical protein